MKLSVKVPEGKSLYQVLRDKGFLKSAYCGGKGICGKCRVKIQGKEELACLIFGPISQTIELNDEELLSSGEILENIKVNPEREKWGIAVDLGTTTVEAALFNLKDGRFTKSLKTINLQSSFGADVITRVEAARESYTKERDLLIETVNLLLQKLNVKADEMVVVSNPVMQHFLLNLPVDGFEKFPFNLYQKEAVTTYGKEIGIEANEIFIPPPVGNFVGSDFLSNIICLKNLEDFLLVDFGTNAEIGLVSSGKFLTTSVPAGPAFEGVGLFSGMRAVDGAISKAWFDGKTIKFQIIGRKEAEGICASGYFDIIYLMKMFKVIDSEGNFSNKPLPFVREFVKEVNGEKAFVIKDSPYLVAVTQSDVRKFQLAKAAIYGAISTLVERTESLPKEIILSGAMGTSISITSISGLKLFPFPLKKVRQPGNLSIRGAATLLGDYRERERIEEVKRAFEIVDLSTSKTFEEKYIEGLEF
jgi:uncharacterized 2Fe-2S/4Fe-4S cluster protein (DUF4445 family)